MGVDEAGGKALAREIDDLALRRVLEVADARDAAVVIDGERGVLVPAIRIVHAVRKSIAGRGEDAGSVNPHARDCSVRVSCALTTSLPRAPRERVSPERWPGGAT